MKSKIKVIDWVVSFYLGYVFLNEYNNYLGGFSFIWLLLFVVWSYSSSIGDFEVWRTLSIRTLNLTVVLLGTFVILGSVFMNIFLDIESVKSTNLFVLIDSSINEEIIFRGYLFHGLEKVCEKSKIRAYVIKMWFPIVVSSALFSLIHFFNVLNGYSIEYVVVQTLIAFMMGIALGAIRNKQKTIKECILIHIVFNLISYI